MKKRIIITGFLFSLIASNALAGNFSLRQGDLLADDKVDIVIRKQSGNCPTKFPVESIDCSYSDQKMTGFLVLYLDKLTGEFTTESTFLLNISLNSDSKGKGYNFNTASCTNLQEKVTTGSVITVNKTGCVVQ